MNVVSKVIEEEKRELSSEIAFIDLFAGIGGFHQAFHNIQTKTGLVTKCVFASEIDKHARKTYEANFRSIDPEMFELDNFAGDIQEVDKSKIPDHDILCGGFPCQPFSQAGYKKGFQEDLGNRGNMFFQIVEILKEKKPKAFFLENVRHIKNHDNGRTFDTIKYTLENLDMGNDLCYSFHSKMVKASDHGLPQHRPRIFMVGFRNDLKNCDEFEFPEKEPLTMTMSDIFGAPCNKAIGYTLRVGGRSSGIMDRRNWDGYIVDGKEIRLNPEHGKKMMGLPKDFNFPVPMTQAMKQLGNSVAVPAVEATLRNIIDFLNN